MFESDPDSDVDIDMDTAAMMQSDLPLTLLHQGKVREVYDAGDAMLLIVASDRVSAFDVVLPQPIPSKGEVLTQLTVWWLAGLHGSVDHHVLSVDPDAIVRRVPSLAGTRDTWARRSMLVRRTEPLMVECVVRGYITGSAWREYRDRGTLAGQPLADGLTESQRLQPTIFSPATKAVHGHDENITFEEACRILGSETAERTRDLSLRIYEHGSSVAEARGIILADTKFEFGFDAEGRLLLIDEVLTPDSSRFWPGESYATGRGQPSLDKQPVRDYLDGLEHWNKAPPPPDLPDQVVQATTTRYREIFRRLTGTELNDYEPPTFEDLS